jgi:small subunit ribosomal protein S3e
MKGWDPEGQLGPRKPLPDSVQILEPPVDKVVSEPSSDHREQPAVAAAPVDDVYQQPEGGFEQQPAQEQPAF